MHYHPFWRSHPHFCLFRKDKKCVHLLNAEVLSTGISYRYYAFLNSRRCQILTSLFIKIRSPLVTQQSEPVLGSILFLLIFVLFFALVFSPFLKSGAICGPPFIYVSVYVRAKNRSFRAATTTAGIHWIASCHMESSAMRVRQDTGTRLALSPRGRVEK